MKHIVVIAIAGSLLTGCSNFNFGALKRGGTQTQTDAGATVLEAPSSVETGELRPVGRSNEVAPKPAGRGPLGATVASLGNPAEAGLWLKTPLARVQQMGVVTFNGKRVNVTLIPIEGEASAGSRMSLHAFQALGAPLTDLVEVNVSI